VGTDFVLPKRKGADMVTKFEVMVKDDPKLLAQAGAYIFTRAAQAAVKERGGFAVAVSGGSTPRPMHRMLAAEPYRSEILWQKTSFFWVDERCVPVTDEASNYGAAKADLLGKVPIPVGQIHPMPVEMAPDDGALKYERVISDFFRLGEGHVPPFDLIFLGIGVDGHTASLFPGQKVLKEKKRWVVAVKGGQPNVDRLTMTFSLLNQARQIVFLVSGKRKTAVLKTLFEDKEGHLPAGMIRPLDGNLIWLVDRDAAAGLPKEFIYGNK
jgi:6-phosphogluconolactonase